MEKPGEGEREEDIVHKMARVAGNPAIEYSARVVIGDVYKDKDKILDRASDDGTRHGIARWSASKQASQALLL